MVVMVVVSDSQKYTRIRAVLFLLRPCKCAKFLLFFG